MAEHLLSIEPEKILEKNQDAKIFYIFQGISLGDREIIAEIIRNPSKNNSNLLKLINHKMIQKKITFDFYSIYKAYVEGWENSELSKSKIRKEHDLEIKTLLNFSKNYINNLNYL